MTQEERVRHEDNIWYHLLRAKGTLATIQLKMMANKRNIID
jgi:hypothetical protein